MKFPLGCFMLVPNFLKNNHTTPYAGGTLHVVSEIYLAFRDPHLETSQWAYLLLAGKDGSAFQLRTCWATFLSLVIVDVWACESPKAVRFPRGTNHTGQSLSKGETSHKRFCTHVLKDTLKKAHQSPVIEWLCHDVSHGLGIAQQLCLRKAMFVFSMQFLTVHNHQLRKCHLMRSVSIRPVTRQNHDYTRWITLGGLSHLLSMLSNCDEMQGDEWVPLCFVQTRLPSVKLLDEGWRSTNNIATVIKIHDVSMLISSQQL